TFDPSATWFTALDERSRNVLTLRAPLETASVCRAASRATTTPCIDDVLVDLVTCAYALLAEAQELGTATLVARAKTPTATALNVRR
ncbi:MAG TPA: hypothetical protein VNE22_03995, partial [Acidimicrobiales bacterium]|nr:hypothetical protein [Acidimicrobiales bacterium]